jgi:hypothetical protein
MLLHSWQQPDFDITKQVDHSKSSMGDDEIFAKAYNWLFNLIGTDQIVWSWADPENHVPVHMREQKYWVLDVPESELIYLNTYCWDCVIGDWFWYPLQLNMMSNNNLIEKFIDKWEKERAAYKEQDWLDNVFDKKLKEDTQVLIKGPVKQEWVISCSHISDYDLSLFDDGIINEWCKSEKERDKKLQIYKKCLDSRGIEYTVEIKKKNRLNKYHFCIEWD